MPALLVIRDTGDTRDGTGPPYHPKMEEGGEKKKREKETHESAPTSLHRRAPAIACIHPSIHPFACLPARAARDDILKIRERATRRGGSFPQTRGIICER